MILSFAQAQEAKRRTAMIAAKVPHCGPCYELDGDFNELVPIILWTAGGSPILGSYCCQCGEEFT